MKLTTKQIIWGSVGLASIFIILALIKKLTPYKKNIVKTATDEWARFGYQTIGKDGKYIKQGAKEHHNGYWERVRRLLETSVRQKIYG